MMKKSWAYALIPEGSNVVENIIVANDSFKKKGYYTIKYYDSVFCQPGMYYNKNDSLFYDSPDFKEINGIGV